MPDYRGHRIGQPRDEIKVEVEMTRYDFGGRIVMKKPVWREAIPFTLGPWKGTAEITQASELKMDEARLVFSFDLVLLPDEEISLAKTMVEFFGAEIVE